MKLDSNISEGFAEACRVQMGSARLALEAGRRETAWAQMFEVLGKLAGNSPAPDLKVLRLSTTLELSNLSFVMGRGFQDLVAILQDALPVAEELGDLRSGALLKMHLGRLYYFGERRVDAIALLAEGKKEAERLGDEDILVRTAEFSGLYFFIQGLFSEASTYFEKAMWAFETTEEVLLANPSAPIWLGYCAAYLGQFHRAIGTLDYYWRFAFGKSDRSLAATIRAVLGVVLLMVKRMKEGEYHLSGALEEAVATKNALAIFFARGGLAYHRCLLGRLEETRDMFDEAFREAAAVGIVRQYTSPLALEMLYELHQSALCVESTNFEREVARMMKEPNPYLHGVALRLRARARAHRGGNLEERKRDLEESMGHLMSAGAPLELAKTGLEIVRIKLAEGHVEAAREAAQKAWRDLSEYGGEFFPDDLRYLLNVPSDTALKVPDRGEFVARFADIIQQLAPSPDLEKLLQRTVAATNRFFGAERGGIFWFRKNNGKRAPILRAACNLSSAEVQSETFRSNLALVFTAFRQKSPRIFRREPAETGLRAEKAMLALPFEVEGEARGVLYHDNSYLDGCFESFDKSELIHMARCLSTYIGQIHSYCLGMEKSVSEIALLREATDAPALVAQSDAMVDILAQADHVADSEGTVLILGETGVGKELLAKRIHQMSARSDRPFVVLDVTTVPENLFESELFGYERGAFTGADRRKRGRVELSHGGTLFIDEVGDLAKTMQAKLLRVLQEKTLTRIGGNQPIHADFRLIAATNKDLAREVADGRFREDLYYRLNVIPITLPPLRERREDVPLLAHHFLKTFASKYGRPLLRMSQETERKLIAYSWPGNVRELQNVMERAVLLSVGDHLVLSLPADNRPSIMDLFSDLPTLDDLQRRYIAFVLEKTNGKIGGSNGAAELLGMKRSSLYRRMEKLGMR
ncbi:MAG: sigma-54-dependent Fis family transcriptional regulator [Pseudomonadota bacterium]